MPRKSIKPLLLFLFTVLLLFSFQQAGQLLSVDELSKIANDFAEAEQNDSASVYYENARKLAKQKKVKLSLQEVLKKELIFWISRADLESHEKRKKINSFWEEFNTDAKFRQYFYDAQSSLFLYESKLDSFEIYRGKTELEIIKNEDWVYAVNYYTFLAQQFLYSDDYIAALKYLKKAESSLLKTKNQRDEELIDFYFVGNEIYNILGNHEQALKYSLICSEIIKQKKAFNSNEYAIALNNIAVNYNELEDYEKGLKFYEEAKKYKLKSGEKEDLSVIFENIGKCLKNLNRFDEAYDACKKALELSFSAERPELEHQISAYEGLADLYIKINKNDSALICADKLLELIKKSNSRLENTYIVLGKIYSAANEFVKARYYFEKAENIVYAKFGKKNFNTARVLYAFASSYLKEKNLNKAFNYIQKAINANSTEDYESLDFKSNPELKSIVNLDLMINQLRLKSIIMDSMRVNNVNNIKALDIYKTSNTVINILLEINQTINYQSKSFWLNERTHTLFQHAIYYALLAAEEEKDEKYKEEAFLMAERSKSILLFESLQEKNALRFAGIPDSLIEKESGLRKYAIFIEKQKRDAVNEKNQERIAEYDRELLEIQQEIDKLTVVLRQKYPAYYQLKYPELKIKPKDIMSKLGDSTVMLEYFQGKQRSFVFVLRNNSFDCHQIVADSTVTNRVLDFQKLVSDLPYAVKSPDEYFGKYSSSALELYNFWLKPFLSPKDKGKRLVIISDGSLSYMPFDALFTQKPETKQANYSNLPYLLRAYTVNYDYSAQLWLQHQQPKPQLNGKILAMAPTYIKKSEDTLALRNRMRSGKERDLRNGITELPGAEKEIKLLKNSYKGFYPTKMNASERVWKKNSADYGIVHFAMHGLIDENEPEFSSLVFAEDGDAQEDNFLYAYEIKQSKLNASLVVLSACETGVGKYQRGEGVMSIGRGFMYAGVPSVVMTLWKLNDQSAAELIGNFYKNLAKGMQKDKALQQAKLQYLEASNNNTAHPALWGCLMQLGDYSVIKIEKVNYFNYLIISLVLGSVLALLIFFYRRMLTQQKSRPN